MPAGRPSKYTARVQKKAEDYLENYGDYGDVMPMLCGLALAIGVHKDTIQDWSKDENKPEFSVLVGKVMQKQESVLFNESLKGEFNASITKLALTKHGYVDKADQTIVQTNRFEGWTDEELETYAAGGE